jgi:hypothetical protein
MDSNSTGRKERAWEHSRQKLSSTNIENSDAETQFSSTLNMVNI